MDSGSVTNDALGFVPFDCDHHYYDHDSYEAEDAFTRYMDPKLAKRGLQWAEVNGRKRLLVGGRINRFIPNPTFDPIARPGSLDGYFRGRVSASDIREAFGELNDMADHPEYRNRDAKIAKLDEQGIGGCLMFPTLGVGMESAMADDLPAMRASFTAFNRWLDDDWGFAYQDRIFAAAYITMSDVDHAVAELEWALDRGARIVNLRAAPVNTETGNVALGDPRHDPFWARVNEAGIAVAFHSGDAGYGFYLEHFGLNAEFEAFRYNPLRSMLNSAPAADGMAQLIAGQVFHRFPNIRVCTIESGATWLAPLLGRMEKAFKQHAHAFPEDPIETFRRHIWIAPFYEDDMNELAASIGVERMLFGSDWPHAEGLENPSAFKADLAGFSDEDILTIMKTNGESLIAPQAS